MGFGFDVDLVFGCIVRSAGPSLAATLSGTLGEIKAFPSQHIPWNAVGEGMAAGCEATSHVASTARKRREMDAAAQLSLSLSFVFSLRIQPLFRVGLLCSVKPLYRCPPGHPAM